MDRLQALLEFHAEDPTDAFTCFALAQEYVKRGDLAAARAFYEGLVRDQPDYVGTYYHLGKLLEDLAEPGTAIDVYRQGIQVAQRQRDLKNLSELQDALLQAQGIGFDDDE
ncbi:MAG: tetratricopeptide repeat protein [Bacteroidota bacterium]